MERDEANGLEGAYGVYRAGLLRFLAIRTGDAIDAEDMVQELWLKVRLQRGEAVANARAYLYRMAQNIVVDRLRAQRRRVQREQRWSDGLGRFIDSRGETIDQSRNAEEEILEREELASLASAIANLPAGARRVFKLHKLEGLSHGEIAARLGISKSGVEKHMAVAMKYLRRAMQD